MLRRIKFLIEVQTVRNLSGLSTFLENLQFCCSSDFLC